MILNEDYKNLNMIDRSLISEVDLKEEYCQISIDSPVEVNKVKDPHSFSHAIEILEQDDVGGIVFRASRKQLCLIYKTNLNANYKMVYSDYAYYNIEGIFASSNKTRYCSINSDEPKRIISNLFLKAYGDLEGVKKVWDILVIKKSPKTDLRDIRKYRKDNNVPLPDDKEYGLYINGLKSNLNDRLVKYKESKMPNLKSKEDFMNYFITQERLQKIKLKDTIYVLDSRDVANNGSRITFIYSRKTNPSNLPFDYIFIRVDFDGIHPRITDIFGSNKRYSNEFNDLTSYIKD